MSVVSEGTIVGNISENSLVVYICSPYSAATKAGVEKNLDDARKYGRFAISRGYIPFIAHLAICGFLDDSIPEEREIGMKTDKAFLSKCDELWCFGNRISAGMESEIRYAASNGIPIRFFSDGCVEQEPNIELDFEIFPE